jgi:integrase/recombinase XerC
LNTSARKALCALGYRQHGGTAAQIFVGQRGPMTPRGVEIVLEKYAKLAGLKGITPDTLRHTFCKNLVDVGADVTSVAALAGHPTLDAARLYYAWPPQGLDRLVELLGHKA